MYIVVRKKCDSLVRWHRWVAILLTEVDANSAEHRHYQLWPYTIFGR